ncbi:ubiquitin-2 like Rad60 SUMO-like-domain-containing protein [Aspergillus floccosus]
MRSFFKRPSWATRGDEELPADFYRRADQTYADIIAARKESREKSTKSPNDSPTDDRDRRKRRRPSHEEDSSLEDDGAASKTPERRRTKTHQYQQFLEVDTHRISSVDNVAGSATPDTCPSPDNASDVIITDTMNATRSSSSVSAGRTHDGSDSTTVDKLVLQSRQEAASKSEITPQDSTPSKDTLDDVVIEILITSKIKDTKPLIVQRKLTQSLKEVRLVWCSRQNLPKESQSAVYLTWKGKRLFDVTTCKSLGIGAGSLTAEDYLQYDEGNMRIHMEAVTDDPSLLPRERQQAVDDSDSAQESSQLEDTGRLGSQSIVLKCPGYADLGISTVSNMKVSEVISIFREARNIPEGQNVYLTFDGDRLEPENRLEDYDIADDDLLDVIVR